MHYFLLIYFNSKPLHLSSRLAAHHQGDQLWINSNLFSHVEKLWNCLKLLEYMFKSLKSVKHFLQAVYTYRVVRRRKIVISEISDCVERY